MKEKVFSLIMIIMILFSYTPEVFASDMETPSGVHLMELEEFIDHYMAEYIGKTSPGAAVVLVKNDEIIFSKGYGYANIKQGSRVDSKSTVFEYGSISKLFVYMTIMRLVEEERIDLHADIRMYLPTDFLKKLQFDDPITMMDIMNHTTGFEDYLFDVILTTSQKRPSMEQTLHDAQPLQVYKPGTISAYSNYAVALSAYIAEQIIGQDFHEYLMETVFLPLGMNDTSAHPRLADRPELLKRKAEGYKRAGTDDFEPGGWSYIPLYPVGSVNGTAEDLARFAMALMPEDDMDTPLFDSRDTLDEMLTQTHPMGPGLTGFAHGFIEWDGEYRGLGHGGNTAYFSSQMNFVPEERFGVIILTNTANEMDLTSGLTEALIGKRNQTTTTSSDKLPNVKEVEGVYLGARKMYSGFLDLYGYLSLLDVKALEDNKIEMSMAGQTSTLVQTAPYVYQRTEAHGSIFKYHFGKVYFDLEGGEVKRISGDFVPLPSGRSIPWLITSLVIAFVSAAYFILTPLVLLMIGLRRKKKRLSESSPKHLMSKLHTLLVLCGTATVINVSILIMRMLSNNYRSFSEVKIHILLNYPLIALASLLIIILALRWNDVKLSKYRKLFYVASAVIMVSLTIMLINWQFFDVIA